MVEQQQGTNLPNGSDKPDIDRLAEEVYRLLIRELRIEQERQPSTSRRPFIHSRRTSG